MTMSNNDMIGLFPDVVDCMNLPSLEIKKMYVEHAGSGFQHVEIYVDNVYNRCFLYLVNYARMKPEIALKALPILVNVCGMNSSPSHGCIPGCLV